MVWERKERKARVKIKKNQKRQNRADERDDERSQKKISEMFCFVLIVTASNEIENSTPEKEWLTNKNTVFVLYENEIHLNYCPTVFDHFRPNAPFIFFQLLILSYFLFHLFLFSTTYFDFTLHSFISSSYLTCQRPMFSTLSHLVEHRPHPFLRSFFLLFISFSSSISFFFLSLLALVFIAFLFINCSFSLLPIFSLMPVCFSFTLSLSNTYTHTSFIFA